MKTKNLLFAGAIALSTVMSPVAALVSSTPIFAETPNAGKPEEAAHTITISEATEGYVYDAYQIFKGSTTGTKDDQILANVEWGSGVKTSDFTDGKFENKTAQEWANELKTPAQAREFASKIAAHLSTTKSSGTVGKDGSTVINVTGDGYYLIKDGSTGNTNPTEFIMQVVDNVSVTPKTTEEPKHEKKVLENSAANEIQGTPDIITGTLWNDVADYDLHTSIPFTLAAEAPNTTNYTQYEFDFQDTMDEGLTLDESSVVVKVDGTVNTANVTNISKSANAFSLTVVLKGKIGETNVATIDEGAVITVEFTAQLNDKAKLNKVGNENKFVLSYSNNPSTNSKGTTEPDKVVVFTYEMDLLKVDKDSQKALTGAEFKLYKLDTDGETKHYMSAEGTNGSYTFKDWEGSRDDGKNLVSTTNRFEIKGLDEGIYYLEELVAPAGYNLPDTPFTLELEAVTNNNQLYVGKGEDDTESKGIESINIKNQPGTEMNIENTKGTTLPETGGMGTTMLYTVGGILVAGSAIFFTVNKRMKRED